MHLTEAAKTIVAIALPTIVSDLQGGNSYSWVGKCVRFFLSSHRWVDACRASAYVLAAGAFGPLYGKLSNMFGRVLRPVQTLLLTHALGRKPLLYSSIIVFLVCFPGRNVFLCLLVSFQSGSALCGAAQNMTWLIVCRALQGVGGGGIMQLSIIVISDIVPLKEYA